MKKDMDELFIRHMIKLLDSSIPTENDYRFWINHTKVGFHSNEISGKWCIFSTESTINKKWESIKNLIDSGDIIHAKVSTKRYLPNSRSKKYIVCVYTNNFNDLEDLVRTRELLRGIGFKRPLNYKRDIDTMNGVRGKKEYYTKM
jgi:hypothetical protein